MHSTPGAVKCGRDSNNQQRTAERGTAWKGKEIMHSYFHKRAVNLTQRVGSKAPGPS